MKPMLTVFVGAAMVGWISDGMIAELETQALAKGAEVLKYQ